jgi:hypothetical protein
MYEAQSLLDFSLILYKNYWSCLGRGDSCVFYGEEGVVGVGTKIFILSFGSEF